ncbi:hypothetical protein HY358_00220 [Candidatus Roizmanbacteria bacterium]|nr:hypothetical protein [Candidatus Roizmanbacteria bacterium]
MITKAKPFTAEEIERLREAFDVYIKTVIDIGQKICSAGMDRHYEGEELLIQQGSLQSDIWGGGIDLETKMIDFNSFINIRPIQNNPSNEILDPKLRKQYQELTKFFFRKLYE